jgi:AraC-like DNA-binding protein
MEAMVNAGAVRQLVRFAREIGICLESVIDKELQAIAVASASVERVPAHAIVDMLQLCSIYTDRPDLGASVAAWAKVRGGFGPLSLSWEYSPTLAETIRVNQRFIHVENRAVAFHVTEEGDEVALQHLLMVPARYGGSQFIEASLTLDLRVARMVLGNDSWSPARIELTHPAPPSTRFQRTLFRCPIEFGANRNAIVIKRSDMMRPAPNGDAQMFAYLERHLQSVDDAGSADLPRRVKQLISANLANGHATLEKVARCLAKSPRTLQRQLAEHNLTFATLLAEVRRRTTEEFFRSEQRPSLTRLADRLGYSDNSAASRYLRTNFHTGAKALRA